MAKRFYLSDIIGSGTLGDPYRPRLQDVAPAANVAAVIPTGADGKPVHAWCLALVATDNHAPLREAAGIDPLPDFPLDGKLQAIQAATRNAMFAALQRRGVAASGIENSDGYRDVIRAIGQRLQADFDENRLDVSEAG